MTQEFENLSFFGEEDKPLPSTDWKWSFKDYPKEKNGLKVFSCFACGGGSTMGYKLAGCDVLGCVEIDPEMNEIYEMNHHPRFNYCMDIRDFNNLPNESIPQELFDLDILDGSPPCTTFSITGNREETWGKKKKFREGQKEQTLDDLSFVFIDTVRKLKPKVVIMENVEGLMMGEAFPYVQRIFKEFKSAGYDVYYWRLKGEEMGVPQTRHRVFFVACRNDLEVETFWLNMEFNYEEVTYGQIKSGVGEKLNEDTVSYQWLLKATPEDKRLGDTIARCGEPEKLFNHRICWPHRTMQTITAAGDIYRGEEKTCVSVEDIIHGQTFPEDYVFPKRTFSKVKYICGMSVPPVMIKRIVNKLIEQGVFDYALKHEDTN